MPAKQGHAQWPCGIRESHVKPRGMDPPDLDLLRAGDEGSWDAAFKWLWPTAFAVAKNKLYYRWPNEVEDRAGSSLTIAPPISRQYSHFSIEA
jgi:hypothetical protein